MHRVVRLGYGFGLWVVGLGVDDNRASQQAAFDCFRDIYNNERPHEALGNAVPAAHYKASPRGPIVAVEPSYSSDAETRKVRYAGKIILRGDQIHISKALAGETVLLEPSDEEQRYFLAEDGLSFLLTDASAAAVAAPPLYGRRRSWNSDRCF